MLGWWAGAQEECGAGVPGRTGHGSQEFRRLFFYRLLAGRWASEDSGGWLRRLRRLLRMHWIHNFVNNNKSIWAGWNLVSFQNSVCGRVAVIFRRIT